MEFVEESKGDKGVYLIDGQIRKSNTSEIAYGWGLDKSQVKSQFIDPGVREVIRRIKDTGKVMSQAKAIEVAYEGIQTRKDSFTVFGTEMHKQFENFELNKALKLPTPKHESYFQGFLFFRKRHTFEPILIEGRLHCECHNLTTQIDWYGQVDDMFTVCDYKTGRTVGAKTPIQLAINKHVLEQNGYIVQQLWAVHVQEDFAYPIEFNFPWEEAEIVFKNAEIKERLMCPKVYIRKMANEDADNDEEIETPVVVQITTIESEDNEIVDEPLSLSDLGFAKIKNAVKRGRGRPKGSLNKQPKLLTEDEIELVI